MTKTFDQLNITWRDPERAECIFNLLKEASKLVLATDYDGTLTPEAGGNWHSMRRVLPEAGQIIHKELYEEHIPLEKSGDLTDAKNRQWSTAALDLHVDYGTNINDLQSIINTSELRPGAIDFINTCKEIGMLNVVVSAGVEAPIRLAAIKHGMAFDKIIAAKLNFDEHGVVKSWDKDTLIIPGNKQEKLRLALDHILEEKPGNLGFLIVGDKKHDSQMAASDAGTLMRIMVGVDPNLTNEQISKIWDAQFDGIIFGNELFSLEALVRSLRT